MKSTGNYSDEIKKLKKAIEEADAVVIGAYNKQYAAGKLWDYNFSLCT